MIVEKSLVDRIALPAAIISCEGDFIYENVHFESLFEKIFASQLVKNIKILDGSFDCDELGFSLPIEKEIYLNLLKVNCVMYKVKFLDSISVLYIIDNVLFNKDIVNILDHIGDIIDITNSEGVVELINDAVYNLTGLNKENIQIGSSLLDKHSEGFLSEPAFCSVIKERKPIVKRVKYKSGRTLLNRGYPVFSESGEIEKVIIFGQDVTQISSIEERVILSENEGKLILKYDAIDQYFKENNLIYANDSIKNIVNIAIKVAPTNTPVFIWGESGVGKEVIAKVIHNTSNRKNKPFMAINCAAIPSDLFESELFGYEQGSFTGANKLGKKGLLEEADGGTVFLDEVCEMPYDLQSKLLRVIQEGKVRKVGGIEDKLIDVRYLSATNLNIEEVTKSGKFRMDLYYRLSVIPLFIPPLRDRRDDIIVLTRHFLDIFNKDYNKSVSLSQKAVRKLIGYSWPGNVREIRNLIQRLVLLSEEEYIKDIDFNLVGIRDKEPADCSDEISIGRVMPIKSAINIIENKLINMVYKETSSIVKTAEILEINPSTIHRKIKNGEIVLE